MGGCRPPVTVICFTQALAYHYMPLCVNAGCARELSLGALFCDYCQTPGRVLSSESDPWLSAVRLVGKQVKDRYRIQGILRADETGILYSAHDMTTGDDVALRILPAKLVAGQERFAALQAAVRSSFDFKHVNLIPCTEFDADGQDVCILYQLVEGESVARYQYRRTIERGVLGLPPDETLVVLEGVADGLDALHRRGIVHRGLRPANVILTHEGNVIVPRVAEVGVANLLRTFLSRLGKPEHFPFPYTSPEEIRGEAVEKSADLFALGCLAWELLMGRSPFPGSDRGQRILGGAPEGLDLLDESVRSVLARALDPDPQKRWPSSRPFVEALSRVLPADPRRPPVRFLTSARSLPKMPSAEEPLPPPRKARWIPLAVLFLIAGAMISFTIEMAAYKPTSQPPLALTTIAFPESSPASPSPVRTSPSPRVPVTGSLGTVGPTATRPSIPVVPRGSSVASSPTASPSASLAASPLTSLTTGPSLDAATSEAVEGDLVPLQKNTQGFYEFLNPVDESRMVLIPKGPFWMGANEVSDEGPAHEVWLSAFLIDRTECSVGQYKKYLASTHGPVPKMLDGLGDQEPMGGLSWMEARDYLTWAKKIFPTEAQWEKAARGRLVGVLYPWGVEPPTGRACFGLSIESGKTKPVASYSPNGYGLYDCAGNVLEWCLDSFDPAAYKNHADRDPVASSQSDFKVIRGGSYADGPQSLKVSVRNRLKATVQGIRGVGFRGVRIWKGPEP